MATPTSDPALSVLDRALRGDEGALSFLDRTLSIYVLDATDPSKPKTYGSWNFIHQAMNEVERREARGEALHGHVQLLATIAKRVARRSPATDRQLVETCISNAHPYHATAQQSQSLVDINYELREIVMGRIAAVCFDFAFHQANSNSSYKYAMESLCAVLSANAVSSGPSAVLHLMVEWIVPSRNTLPPLAITCVALHLAMEAMRMAAPAGTKEVLQQLSAPTIGLVVAPVLVQAVQDSYHALIATCIRALERWFVATDLSLPQTRHLCQKVDIDICQVLADIMYSDNAVVVDAMAEWMEVALLNTKMSNSRMAQARHLMRVDEASFQQSISEQELERIEEKEIALILKELMSAISLQRFRFVERQARADHGVCRNLTRIAASICKSLGTSSLQEGMVDLLLKAAAHPMVHVCSIALDILKRIVMEDTTFSFRLLPVLQHRAIIPHTRVMGAPSLSTNTSGVEFGEFENFRQCHLVDALVTCFRQNPNYYMDSCTSAIEEFCGAAPNNNNIEVCFQLEAALYCVVAVADEALQQDNTQDPLATDKKTHDAQLRRCTMALTSRPCTSNPLTMAQQCLFLGSYSSWFATHEGGLLDSAAELSLVTFNMATSPFASNAMIQEMLVSPFAAAASALEHILTRSPRHFTTIPAITALGGAWEASYAASNQGNTVTIEDRKVLCHGICCTLASLPHDQRSKSFLALSLPTVDCLDKMTKFANDTRAQQQHPTSTVNHLDSVLVRVADEVQILSTMTSSFRDFVSNSTHDTMESGCVTGADGGSLKNPSLEVLRRTWPCITHLSRTYYAHEKVSEALGEFLARSVPRDANDDENFSLLKDLYEIACSILKSVPVDNVSPRPVFCFVEEVINIYGGVVERSASYHESGDTLSHGRLEEVARLVEGLLLASVDAARASLWTTQTLGKEQGQGQQPFECKTEPRPVTQEREKSTDALSGLFSILALCTQKCPVFLVRLPADGDDEMLAVRAVEAAVSALVETQDEVSRSAMSFLTAAVDLHESSVRSGENGMQTVRQLMEGVFVRTRRSIIMMLLAGACGTFAHVTLEPAAALLYAVLKTLPADETEPFLVAALQQEQFLLGDDVRIASLAVFRRCALGDAPESLAVQLFADLWSLHQTDEAGAVAGGDAVLRFVQNYTD